MTEATYGIIESWFRPRRRFWTLLAWVTGGASVAKGVRFPNRWSATQALVDYRFGVVKRGLFGTLISDPLHLWRFHRFVVVSAFLVLALISLLVLYIARSEIFSRFHDLELLVLFTSGYGLTYIVHLIGYLDIVLCGVTLALLLIPNLAVRFMAAVPLVILSVMVHEIFLPLFLPVLLFSLLVQGFSSGNRVEVRRAIISAVVLATIGIGTAVWLASERPLSDFQTTSITTDLQSKADFPIRTDFFLVMRSSASDNLTMMRSATHLGWWQRQQLICIIALGPSIALLLAGSIFLIRSDAGLPAVPMIVLAFVAALSPLSLHVIGWDAARWNAWAMVTTFLVLLTLCRYTKGPVLSLGPGFRNAALMLILLNMATGGMLLDGETVNSYPFIPDRHTLREVRRVPQWKPSGP